LLGAATLVIRPPPSPEPPLLLVLPPELVLPELVPPLVVPPLVVPPLVVPPLLATPLDELVDPLLPELPVAPLLPPPSSPPNELSTCGFAPLHPAIDTPVAIVAMPIHRMIFMAPSKEFRCPAARRSKPTTLSAHDRVRTSGTQSAPHVPRR
jgi:hypothetical protein